MMSWGLALQRVSRSPSGSHSSIHLPHRSSVLSLDLAFVFFPLPSFAILASSSIACCSFLYLLSSPLPGPPSPLSHACVSVAPASLTLSSIMSHLVSVHHRRSSNLVRRSAALVLLATASTLSTSLSSPRPCLSRDVHVALPTHSGRSSGIVPSSPTRSAVHCPVLHSHFFHLNSVPHARCATRRRTARSSSMRVLAIRICALASDCTAPRSPICTLRSAIRDRWASIQSLAFVSIQQPTGVPASISPPFASITFVSSDSTWSAPPVSLPPRPRRSRTRGVSSSALPSCSLHIRPISRFTLRCISPAPPTLCPPFLTAAFQHFENATLVIFFASFLSIWCS